MPTFVEYELEDGLKVLVESSGAEAGNAVRSLRPPGEPETVKAEKKFDEALEGVHRSALRIKEKFAGLRADEVEVSFGLKTTGKLGNFAIAEVGVEANYTVKLKWNNRAK
jgi:hypothetical protein